MGIYRGPGGPGDATGDATNEALKAIQAAAEAELSRDQAAASAVAAANSATSASTSDSDATAQAIAAAASASAAATSASNASSSATSASSSASAASTSATNAASSESNAATSATSASNSASAASTSASSASASATTATNEANDAAASAVSALSNAITAITKASEASTSASNAATSETNASGSASSASTSATNAITSASTATTQAGIATTQASTATTQATNAATSASNASTSASNASTSETNASNSASSASTSAANAAASYDDFDDRYLGAKATAPTLDNDGDALITGALYFDTVDNAMKIWDGSVWLDAYASLSGALIADNNLSDLNNVATARTNLGLEIGVNVQAYDANTTKNDVANTFTANQVISVTDNTNAALRVTQTGTGDALLVEDATNPDSTPFVIDANGNVGIGTSSPSSKLDVSGTVTATAFEGDGSGLTGLSSGYTDADALSLFNVSGSAPVYACRAWVNFNGTGTVAIRASGNVSSITDRGVGLYTANFTNAMPDANYAMAGTGSDAGTVFGAYLVAQTRATNYCDFFTGGYNQLQDTATTSIIVMR
jgi:hypothetical protein